MYTAIEMGAKLGMQTMEQCLAKLVKSSLIDEDAAMRSAKSAAVMRERLKR